MNDTSSFDLPCDSISDQNLKRFIWRSTIWLKSRESTMQNLQRLAEELDKLHQTFSWTKVGGGLVGLAGGATFVFGILTANVLAVAMGVNMAAGGAATAGFAEQIENIRSKTSIEKAQQSIDEDTASLNQLFVDLFEHKNDWKRHEILYMTPLTETLYPFLKLGFTKYGVSSVSSFLKEYEKLQAGEVVSETMFKSPLWVAENLNYLIEQAVNIKDGNLSDAARDMRNTCDDLDKERKFIHEIVKRLKEERQKRQRRVREKKREKEKREKERAKEREKESEKEKEEESEKKMKGEELISRIRSEKEQNKKKKKKSCCGLLCFSVPKE